MDDCDVRIRKLQGVPGSREPEKHPRLQQHHKTHINQSAFSPSLIIGSVLTNRAAPTSLGLVEITEQARRIASDHGLSRE